MKRGLWFQIIYAIVILILFYSIGLSIYFLMIVAVLFTLIILLKGKLYNKIKDFVDKKFPAISRLPSWLQKLIIILFFISIYILIKQIVFFILKIAGFDIQKIMMDSINQSLGI